MEFKNYHPIIIFIYFIMMICFSCVFMHPMYLCISMSGAFSYLVILKGMKKSRTSLLYMLPMIILMALLNPVFNHRGVTILTYLPNGNPITAESMIYGGAAAVMLASVILWFSCYTEIMTSDKFIYLFGRNIPSLSLVLSMTLRFVPRFVKQIKSVSASQKALGKGVSRGSLIDKVNNSAAILATMMTWSLENSITTADSMKSRGYGTGKRTAFSVFRFDIRDKLLLICELLLGIYIVLGAILKATTFNYYPYISYSNYSLYNASVLAAYVVMVFLPHTVEIREVIRWKSIQSKI